MKRLRKDSVDHDYDPEIELLEDLRKHDEQAYQCFLQTRRYIEERTPTLMKILKTPLLTEDRALLLQYFDIFSDTDPVSEKRIQLSEKINKMLDNGTIKYQKYSNFSVKDHKRMKKEISVLEEDDNNHDIKFDIISLNTSTNNKKVIYSQYKKLLHMNNDNEEYFKLKNWLNWSLKMPYNNTISFNHTKNETTKILKKIRQKLDIELYGMENVKEQILLFVHTKLNNPNMKKCSLSLVGPPGTGKTVISRLLADVLDFPFEQISLGGISSSNFLKGHEYTYIGSQPGEIVRCLARMKYKNGIIFLDEYEKIVQNQEMKSSLLHIMDPSQNMEFSDNFLAGLKIDLSHIWWIKSMNSVPTDTALRDRDFVIEITGYDRQDKFFIVKDYIIPKCLKDNNICEKSISINDIGIYHIIDKYSPEHDKGVRNLERCIYDLIRKIDFLHTHKNKIDVSFSSKIKYPIILDKKIIDLVLKSD